MKKQKAPDKIPDLLKKIRECIGQNRYQFSRHALERVTERGIDIQTVKHVLLNGHEDSKKTIFDKVTNNWKYAISGTTVDDLLVRVIVRIDENGLLVITVMHIL